MTISKAVSPQKYQVRVYYEDTDAAGVVYYANYLRFAERARTEFFRTFGYDHLGVCAEHNLVIAVRRVEVEYKAPARLDDHLDISTGIVSCKNSSLTMSQIISRDSLPLVEIKVVLVAVGLSSGRAVRIPPQLRQICG